MTDAVYISKYIQSRLSNPKPQPLSKHEKRAQRGAHILSKIIEIAKTINNEYTRSHSSIKTT
jgi:hypothetical protein